MQTQNTTTAVATLSSGTSIVTSKGKTVGTKYDLGTGPISLMKKALRESGLSARDASMKIAEMLKGAKGNLAWAEFQTAAEVARAKGMFPTQFELREKSFTIRGAVAPTVKPTKIEDRAAALACLGITEEEFKALLNAKK